MASQAGRLFLLTLATAATAALAASSPSFAQAPAQMAGLAALGASPQAGWVATGEATVTSSRGTETGTVSISAWGASHCRVTIDVSIPGEARRYEAVLDGTRARVIGPQELTRALAAPAWREGCALLPQGLLLAELGTGKATLAQSADGGLQLDRVAGSAGAPTLTLNPQGLPASLNWQEDKRGAKVTLAYADYAATGGATYPATITETVAGGTRLAIHLTSFSAHPGFAESDFALPSLSPPRHVAAGAGGAQ
jgi:hypothetical protein